MAAEIITKTIDGKKYTFKFGVLTAKYYSQECEKKGLEPYQQPVGVENDVLILFVGLKAFGFENNELPIDFSEEAVYDLSDSLTLQDQQEIFDAADRGMTFFGASMMRQLIRIQNLEKSMKELQTGKTGITPKKSEIK